MNQPLVQLDRLVDGELTQHQRRELLAWLDAHPQHWRDCSLAFLEAQSWRSALREGAPTEGTNHAATPRASNNFGVVGWLTLAASVALAFVTGTQVPQRSLPHPTDPQVASVVQQPTTAPSGSPRDVITLWAVDEQGQRQSLRVPLVEAEWLDQRVPIASGLDATTRQGLRDRGYDVQSRRRYAPLVLDDGRPLILPVEDTQIIPVSREVY